jgi:hypothetical protein
MRGIMWVGLVAIAACGSGTSPQSMKTSSVSVNCSRTVGLFVGPIPPDAGDVQGCGPGGTCTYVTVPPPAGQPACDAATRDDSGDFDYTCPVPTFKPYWACVYTTGSSSDGG